MKIALVELSSRDYLNIYSLFPMPRGVPQVAAILRDQGHEVTCFIESVKRFDWRMLLDFDMIGFGIITCTANPTYAMIRKLNEAGYRGKIFTGGPHATALPNESLEAGAIAVIRHEADITCSELITALIQRTDLKKIQGISYWKSINLIDNDIVHNSDRAVLTVDELSDLPFPAFNTIFGYKHLQYIPIIYSRGCPYNCEFCAVKGMFGSYRYMSLEGRIKWLTVLKEKYPHLKLFFADDNFIGDREGRKITIEMLKEMIVRDLIPENGWICQMRVTDADKPLVQLLKRAGCKTVCLGIESPNPDALKEVKKGIKPDDIRSGLFNLHEAGIETLAMTIAGIDTDTFRSFYGGIRQLTRWGITFLQVLAIVPLPYTKHTNKLDADNRKYCKKYDRYNGMHVLYKSKNMSKLSVWMCVYLVSGWFYFISPNGRKLLKKYFWKYCKMVNLVIRHHIKWPFGR